MKALYALDRNDSQSGVTMTTPPTGQPISETEYWEKYYNLSEVTYEWNNGYLEEKPVSDLLTIKMYKCFFELLEHYLKTNPIAQSVLLEMGFRLVLPNSTEVRRPDLGVILNNNPIPILPLDKSYHGTFDLCVEALSDSTVDIKNRDIVTKKNEYAQGGVKEYYLLDGHREQTQFYRLNARGVYMPIKPAKGGIIKSKVLPGFQFRIEDLYQQLSAEELIEDSVYKDFVLPGYRLEKLARQKAEQRAERLAEKLRSFGIDPNEI
jgi:Uma2 family endonuclease